MVLPNSDYHDFSYDAKKPDQFYQANKSAELRAEKSFSANKNNSSYKRRSIGDNHSEYDHRPDPQNRRNDGSASGGSFLSNQGQQNQRASQKNEGEGVSGELIYKKALSMYSYHH